MREPGTFDAAAEDFRLVEDPGVPYQGCLGDIARLPLSCWPPGTPPDSTISERSHRLWNSRGPAVVALELAAGMVSETRPPIGQAKGAKP